MSSVSEEEFDRSFGADATIAEAFGRGPARPAAAGSVEEFDRAMSSVARAFTGTSTADDTLERDLREAGYTAAGARGVVRWLNDGFSVDTALSTPFRSVENGRVPSLVVSRARQVLERHGRVAGQERGTECSEHGGVGSAEEQHRLAAGQIAEAVDRLAAAYLAAWPSAQPESGARYAKGATDAVLESAARDGRSVEQIVEHLDAMASREAAVAAGVRRRLTESRKTTTRIIETRSPLALPVPRSVREGRR